MIITITNNNNNNIHNKIQIRECVYECRIKRKSEETNNLKLYVCMHVCICATLNLWWWFHKQNFLRINFSNYKISSGWLDGSMDSYLN